MNSAVPFIVPITQARTRLGDLIDPMLLPYTREFTDEEIEDWRAEDQLQTPKDTRIKKAQAVIVEKDAVILAEAKQSKADILATLDKKHFFTQAVMDFVKPQNILTPKMILGCVL